MLPDTTPESPYVILATGVELPFCQEAMDLAGYMSGEQVTMDEAFDLINASIVCINARMTIYKAQLRAEVVWVEKILKE